MLVPVRWAGHDAYESGDAWEPLDNLSNREEAVAAFEWTTCRPLDSEPTRPAAAGYRRSTPADSAGRVPCGARATRRLAGDLRTVRRSWGWGKIRGASTGCPRTGGSAAPSHAARVARSRTAAPFTQQTSALRGGIGGQHAAARLGRLLQRRPLGAAQSPVTLHGVRRRVRPALRLGSADPTRTPRPTASESVLCCGYPQAPARRPGVVRPGPSDSDPPAWSESSVCTRVQIP